MAYKDQYMAKPSLMDTIPTEAPVKAASNIRLIPVKGTVVSRYAQACDDKKKAEATMKELAPQLQEVGVKFVFERNIEANGVPKAMISSVNMVDKAAEEEADGTVDKVRFTWVRKDLKNDPNQVKATLERLQTRDSKPVKLAEYCEWEVTAKFDTKVFGTKDAVSGDMKFDEAKYKKFMKAMEDVAKELKVACPLSCTKALVPKSTFHDRRFADFDLDTNLLLMGVLPTTLVLEPIRATPAEPAK